MINELLLILEVVGWAIASFFIIVGIISFIILIGATSYKIALLIFRLLDINLSLSIDTSWWTRGWNCNKD